MSRLLNRRLTVLVAGLLAMVVFAPIVPSDVALAANPSPIEPPSRNLLVGSGRHVELRGLRASSTVTHSNLSNPFRSHDPVADAAAQQLANEGKTGRRSGVVALPDGQPQVAASFAPQTQQQLAGFPVMDLSRQVTLYGPDQSVQPPDTQLAAGTAYLVEADNNALSVWSKSGALVSSADLNVFFNVPAGYRVTDPRILFDAESGRWFLSMLAFTATNDSKVYLAVSATSDPSGIWNVYLIASCLLYTSDAADE